MSRQYITLTCQHCGCEFLGLHAQIQRGRGKFCGRSCRYAAQQTQPESAVDRFWTRVDKAAACWIFGGNPHRYGQFRLSPAEYMLAHRYSYELAHGPIPDNLWVLHRCDTRGCVNPDHLFLGTPLDNTTDMIQKGRARWVWNYGERVGSAKLNPEKVRAIRARFAAGETRTAIARSLGVGLSTVRNVVNGVTWRHVA